MAGKVRPVPFPVPDEMTKKVDGRLDTALALRTPIDFLDLR